MMRLDQPTENVCQHCENTVTSQFARVFGDNDDVVHRCPACDTYRRCQRGSTAGKDLPKQTDREVTV